MARLLIVDDDPSVRKVLRILLTAHGHAVVEAGSIAQALDRARDSAPDLLLLDLGLPDGDGTGVIAQLRAWSEVPILVLSVRAEERQKVAALDLGANDFVTKPFGVAELLARIRTLLRPRRDGEAEAPVLRCGPLRIDVPQHRVALEEREIALTPREFELLVCLARAQGRVVPHRELLTRVWGPAQAGETQYLRIYVGNLRRKLGPAAARLQTETGIGYRLLCDET